MIEFLLPGGAASGATVSNGGFEVIFSGGIATDTTLGSDGGQSVEGGGTASGVTIGISGFQYVSSGGVAIDTVIGSRSYEVVSSGGVTSFTTVSNGAYEYLIAGAVGSNTTVSSGGTEYVSGIAIATVIAAGGTEFALSNGVASGTTISSGGVERVVAGGTAADPVIAGGTLDLASGAVVGGAIAFSGSDGTLRVDSGAATALSASTISGFAPGDTIDFAGVPATSAALAGGTLTVYNGATAIGTFSVAAAGNTGGVEVVSDGNGGSDITAIYGTAVPGTLTGDGLTDTLMVNGNNGVLISDELSAGSMTYTQIGGLGPEWQFEGDGSFLGDGRDGFLLWGSDPAQPDYGTIVVGEDVGGAAQYTALGGVGPEWQFEGNGPLLGQSTDDFLLWDGSSASSNYGVLVVGSVVGGQAQYVAFGGVGPNWQFAGVGDYLGDGKAGFLIEDQNTGNLVVGEDVGGTAQYTLAGGLGPEWQFEGSGNLLGQGQDDFLIWDGSSASPNYGALVVGQITGGT
ncbi:MAG TPA: hypothetical protein VHX40_04665, partial [Acidimicrobiales bacterium]|nr:hypothetical protein [Acidimicrobiales bacterium]